MTNDQTETESATAEQSTPAPEAVPTSGTDASSSVPEPAPTPDAAPTPDVDAAPEVVAAPEVAEAAEAIADAVDPLHAEQSHEPVPVAEQPGEATAAPAEDPTPPDVPPTEVPPAQLTTPAADAATDAPVDAPAGVPDFAADGAETPSAAEIPTPAEAAEVLRARFDAAAGELGTLAGKIRADELTPKAANAELERIRTTAAAGAALPDTLRPHLETVEQLLAQKAAEARAARAEATAAARVIKDRIVAEAEELAGGEQWRAGGQRLSELLEEWKACARLDRKSDDALWKRFSSARSTFTKRRKAHYASLTAERDTVKSAKVSLVEQAEALSDSTQWAATAAKFRDLMNDWKSAGRAGKEIDDELWERFRAAQDKFFTARKESTPAAPAREAGGGGGGGGRGPRGPRPDRDRDRRPAAAPAPQQPRTNPGAVTRAQETVDTLRNLIESFEAKAAKADAAGNAKAAAEAKEAAEARRSWLAEAERTLAELR